MLLSAAVRARCVSSQLALLAHVSEVCPPSAFPVLFGASRKGFISRVLSSFSDSPTVLPFARLSGSVACAVLAADKGAMMLRVHDVEETVAALRLADAVKEAHTQRLNVR